MKKGNLLLIDDEALLISTLRETLQDSADEIHMAYNGEEGLKIVEEQLIHCIVCDINMPTMNGLEFAKRLRASGDDTPLIFYTGQGNRELLLEAVKYGAFDFLNKPNLSGLGAVIEHGLREGLKGPDKTLPADVHQAELMKLLKTATTAK